MTERASKSQNPSVVREMAVKYQVGSENHYNLVSKAQQGLSVSAFFDLLNISGLTKNELAGLLDLSFKTIKRYQKEGKKLNALNSEQLLKMISLYQKAEEVFGSQESFNRWLRKPCTGLGSLEPLSLMQTSGGIDLIHEELLRIEFGSLA